MKTINPIYGALIWLTFTTVLLCLPGSAIPAHQWFEFLMVDKWVHIFLFSTLTILFSRVLDSQKYWMAAVLVLVYGVGMEFVQKWFIVNRSFDLGDIIADGVGALVGFFVARKLLRKNHSTLKK